MPDKTITPAHLHDKPPSPEQDGAGGWTKGPRTVERHGYGASVVGPDGQRIGWHGAAGSVTLEEAHANATLDAAAPYLAEALADVDTDYLRRFPQGLEGAAEWAPGVLPIWRKVRAALAKARGDRG